MKKLTITEVMPLVRAYQAKDGNSVGGSLHIVLDEGNVSNSHIESCKRYATEQNDLDGVALADILLQMSKTQRRKISARFYR